MKVYITKSNYSKLANSIKLNIDKLKDKSVYKEDISCFNKKDIEKLLIHKVILSSENIEFNYKENKTKDNYDYVFQGSKPSFHKDNSCVYLNSKFTNFQIPVEIKNAGENKVLEFRQWFIDNDLKSQDIDTINFRIYSKFGVKVSKVEFDNSGIEDLSSMPPEELEEKIDVILKDIIDYYEKAEPKKKNVIDKFQKRTFLANSKDSINSGTGYTDDAIKKFLKKYDSNFKNKLIKFLKSYYIAKYNPNLYFDSNLLTNFGFTRCPKCFEVDLSDFL